MKNKLLMITHNITIFVKKVFGTKKNQEKYVIMITTQVNIEDPHI